MKLFIANIPFETSEDEIKDLFSVHGEIVDFYMPKDRDTGNYRGFAFLTFASEDMAQNAIEQVNGQEINGRALHVDKAQEKKSSGGGGGGGKFRNDRGGGGGHRGGRGRDRDRY